MAAPRVLLVGLGNPGARYARNRHNIGFMAVASIAARHGFHPWRARFQGETADGEIGGLPLMALKPLTFMNESGRSVGAACQFFKLAPADVIVFHDELDLAPGRVRVKRGGGAAGHNGLRSIDAHMGSDYRRVRLGIGHPGCREKVLGHVLNDFASTDDVWLSLLLDAVAGALPLLLTGDDAGFMSRVALDSGVPAGRPAEAGDGV